MFVTGNKNKVEELGEHVKTKLAKLTVLDLDLPEIQDSDVLNIVQEKCKRAFEQVNNVSLNEGRIDQSPLPKQSVLIEDTSLHFNALNGMPGPYIKCKFKLLFSLKNLIFKLTNRTIHRVPEGGWTEWIAQDVSGL